MDTTEFEIDDVSYEKLVDENLLKSQSVLAENQIILLPHLYRENYCFAQETYNFIKYSKSIKSNQKIDLFQFENQQIGTLELRSFDIWLPIIQIGSEVLLPIVLGIASNFIYSKLKGREHEEAKVDLTIIVMGNDSFKYVKYNGPAKDFEGFVNNEISNK